MKDEEINRFLMHLSRVIYDESERLRVEVLTDCARGIPEGENAKAGTVHTLRCLSNVANKMRSHYIDRP